MKSPAALQRENRGRGSSASKPGPTLAARKVVAVLDNDQDLTKSIYAHFEAGYDARPFLTIAELLSSLDSRRSTSTCSTGSSARRAR